MAKPHARRSTSSPRSRPSSIEPPALPDEDRALIERFVERARTLPDLQAIVLFGSFAREDVDRRSDVDILLVVDRRDPGSLRADVARLVSEMKPRRDINPILTNLSDLEPSFLRTVFQEGRVLYGKVVLSPDHLALQPRVLLAYDLSKTSPSVKVQVSRLVHGFTSVKTVAGIRKTYRYPGLAEKFRGTAVSRSALLLHPHDAEAFVAQLESRKIPYERWDVYL